MGNIFLVSGEFGGGVYLYNADLGRKVSPGEGEDVHRPRKGSKHDVINPKVFSGSGTFQNIGSHCILQPDGIVLPTQRLEKWFGVKPAELSNGWRHVSSFEVLLFFEIQLFLRSALGYGFFLRYTLIFYVLHTGNKLRVWLQFLYSTNPQLLVTKRCLLFITSVHPPVTGYKRTSYLIY